jgi:hypothetical protein
VRNPRTAFRILLVVQVALGLLGGWLSLAGRGDLPASLRQYALAQPTPAGAELWLGFLFIVLAIVATVGAFVFWRPARPLWAGSFLLACVVAPFYPPAVQTSLPSTLQSVATALSGLLFGLMYFTPDVAALFDVAKPAAHPDEDSIR